MRKQKYVFPQLRKTFFSEEFQPAETGYMFGISDRPVDNGGGDSDNDNDNLNANSAASNKPAAVGAGGGVSGAHGMSAFRNFFFGVNQQSGADAEAILDAENAANLNMEGAAFHALAGNVDASPRSEGEACVLFYCEKKKRFWGDHFHVCHNEILFFKADCREVEKSKALRPTEGRGQGPALLTAPRCVGHCTHHIHI